MQLKDAIQNRKSIRTFSDKPLTNYELKMIHWAAYKVPSAGALYPLEIIRVENIPTVFVIVADFKKTTVKYGDRGRRYVYIEAGHMAQNISLLCVELNLACYCIGAFDDVELKKSLNCKEDPIYMLAIGHKKEVGL